MLTIVRRAAAVAIYLISTLVSAKTAAGTTSLAHKQQHVRRQQAEGDVNADFKENPTLTYNISISTSNDVGWTVSDTVKSFFDAATEKWPTMITGDLTDVSTGTLAGTPTSDFGGFFGTSPYPAMIDDCWINLCNLLLPLQTSRGETNTVETVFLFNSLYSEIIRSIKDQSLNRFLLPGSISSYD
jgi:hypothetical protein